MTLGFLFSNVLGYIPRSALAAILVYTGWKLIDVKATKTFFELSKFEAVIYLTTIVAIVSINLLFSRVSNETDEKVVEYEFLPMRTFVQSHQS